MNRKLWSLLKQADKLSRAITSSSSSSIFSRSIRLFEAGQISQALKLCTRAIEAGSVSFSENEQFLCYRLWIDILAHSKDMLSLKELSLHLSKMILSQKDQLRRHHYLGLKGLVYLEREELEACELIMKQVKQSSSSLLNEFLYRFQIHTQEALKWNDFILLDSKADDLTMANPFFWQALLESRIYKNRENSALIIIDLMDRLFPATRSTSKAAAVLYSQMTYNKKHGHLKSRFFNHKDFPVVAFARASFMVSEEKYEEALKIFRYLEKKHKLKENIHFQIGLCLEALFRKNHYVSFLDEAKKSFQKSLDFDRRHNRSLSHSLIAIQRLDNLHHLSAKASERQKIKNGSKRDPGCWMIHLSSRQYLEAYDAKERDIHDLFFKVPKGVKKDDLILFVGSNPFWNHSSRLIAIYTAQTNAIISPMGGWESHLALDAKMSLPMQINENDLAPLSLKLLQTKGYARLQPVQLEQIKQLIDEDRQHVYASVEFVQQKQAGGI